MMPEHFSLLEQIAAHSKEIYTVLITVVGYIIAVLLIPKIILSRRESGATFAWVLVIFFVPYFGAILFFLFGLNRLKRRRKKKVIKGQVFQKRLEQLPDLGIDYPQSGRMRVIPDPAYTISKLITRVTGYPLSPGNSADIYIDANTGYDDMEKAINEAEHHIHLMSYIYRRDETGTRFRDLLVEKAKQGVEVRLMVDGFGGGEINNRFIAPLKQAGGSFVRFLPLFQPGIRWRPNLRNHRKILVVDNRIGFAGGLNIGDEYQGRKKKFAPWRDTHIRIEGPAVSRLQEIFAEDWFFAAGEDLAEPTYFKEAEHSGEHLIQVVASGPDQDHETIHSVFFTAINEADDYVYLTTPYFVPDRAMLTSLKSAAWRGVDVRILLPGKSDLPFVAAAGRSYYEELIEAGVRVYKHRPGMLHAKTMVVDGGWSTIGSANMDIRSFRLNFESNVTVVGSNFAEALEAVFRKDIEGALEITPEILADKKMYERFAEQFARIFSPVL